jgi:hypothetical protein
MTVQEMTVCVKGDCANTAVLPYQFYAANQTPVIVTIVMPVGGEETGLYRYPKVGEKVLVGTEGDLNYLLGYIPSYADQSFIPKFSSESSSDYVTNRTKFNTEKPMVLRYQQTGKTAAPNTERYSEIGFYHRQTKWSASAETRDDYVSLVKAEGETDAAYSLRIEDKGFPKIASETVAAHIARYATSKPQPNIDQINIHSTGDIHTTAQNYQKVQAKRFEMLAVKYDDNTGKSTPDPELSPNEQGLGDHEGDNYRLKQGDVRIRAGNRVTIKAESEIRLQVGRTTLVINDAGLTITTRKINSNVVNSFDTMLNLHSREGISMFGQTVKIGAGYQFSLSEAMGGSINSLAGVVAIAAKDVRITTYPKVAQNMMMFTQMAEYAYNLVTAELGLFGAYEGGYYTNQSIKILRHIMNIVNVIVPFWKKPAIKSEFIEANTAADNDPDAEIPAGTMLGLLTLDASEMMAAALGLTLNITNTVYSTFEQYYDKGKMDKETRDILNLMGMVVDFGIIDLVSTMALVNTNLGLTPAMVRLRNTGDVIIRASKDKSFYAEEASASATPLSIYPDAAIFAVKLAGVGVPNLTGIGRSIADMVQHKGKVSTMLKLEDL